MQIKMLNFHKMLAGLAAELALGFSYALITNLTGSYIYALLALIGNIGLRYVWVFALKPYLKKYAQMFIFIRTIPFVFMSVGFMLMSVNVIAGICVYVISASLSTCFKNVANNLTFVYSGGTKKVNSVGFSAMFEGIGIAIACIFGGYLLDNLSPIIVTSIALVVYLISCVPLIYYFILNKKNKNFNKDVLSTAVSSAEQNTKDEVRLKKVVKSFKLQNSLLFIVHGTYECLTVLFDVYLASQNKSFASIGLFKSISRIVIVLTNMLIAYFVNRKDIKIWVIIASIMFAAGVFMVPFMEYMWMFYLFGILKGVGYAVLDNYLTQNMLVKARILGIQADMVFTWYTSFYAGGITSALVAIIFTPLPAIIFAGIMALVNGPAIVLSEKDQSRMLVDFLCGNDVVETGKESNIKK